MDTLQTTIASWIASQHAEQPLLLLSSDTSISDELILFGKQVTVCTTKKNTPCGICPACKQAASGNHPDVISITGEDGKITVDDIIPLRTILATSAAKRMVCIPNAHTLLPEAANMLLKTLEEPSRTTRFLLTATNKRRVLPTIRSRCRILFVASKTLSVSEESFTDALIRLSELREAGPFHDSDLLAIASLIRTGLEEGRPTPALNRTALRLRDYYKTASIPGGNTKLAADLLLASLAELRNTSK